MHRQRRDLSLVWETHQIHLCGQLLPYGQNNIWGLTGKKDVAYNKRYFEPIWFMWDPDDGCVFW